MLVVVLSIEKILKGEFDPGIGYFSKHVDGIGPTCGMHFF